VKPQRLRVQFLSAGVMVDAATISNTDSDSTFSDLLSIPLSFAKVYR